MVQNKDLVGERVLLRSLTSKDCTDKYLSWLNDERVNCYLETRHSTQSIELIKEFVQQINNSDHSFLMGIFVGERHIGNIKIGPIHKLYKYADISYFIGDIKYRGGGL